MLNKLKSKVEAISEQSACYLFIEWWFHKETGIVLCPVNILFEFDYGGNLVKLLGELMWM